MTWIGKQRGRCIVAGVVYMCCRRRHYPVDQPDQPLAHQLVTLLLISNCLMKMWAGMTNWCVSKSLEAWQSMCGTDHNWTSLVSLTLTATRWKTDTDDAMLFPCETLPWGVFISAQCSKTCCNGKQVFLIVQIQVSLSLFWRVWFLANALPYRYPGGTILFTENPVHMSSVTCYINDDKEIKSHHALLMFPLWPKQEWLTGHFLPPVWG